MSWFGTYLIIIISLFGDWVIFVSLLAIIMRLFGHDYDIIMTLAWLSIIWPTLLSELIIWPAFEPYPEIIAHGDSQWRSWYGLFPRIEREKRALRKF